MRNEDRNKVGPVLEAGELGRAVLTAIRKFNKVVQVIDRGSYWRVLAPRRCEVTRAQIEQALGRSFRLPQDLERIMPSFSGLLQMSEERAAWYLDKQEPGKQEGGRP